MYEIWTKIVHNLKGSSDSIKDNKYATGGAQSIGVSWDRGIFYRRIFDHVELFYSTSKYLFKLTVII